MSDEPIPQTAGTEGAPAAEDSSIGEQLARLRGADPEDLDRHIAEATELHRLLMERLSGEP